MNLLRLSRGKRVVAATVAVSLVGGAAWAFANQGDNQETVADPSSMVQEEESCDVYEAPSWEEASRLAELCGHDVAVIESYDPWTTMSATPTGTAREEFTASATRTDITGEWEDVDPTIVVDPETGELKVASPVHDIRFDPGDVVGFLSMSTDRGTVSMNAPTELGEPVVDGTQVTWPLLDGDGREIDGTVLRVTVSDDASEAVPVIEVRDPEAYADLSDAADGAVGFEVEVSDGLKVANSRQSGGFDVIDEASGEAVFAGGEALQWDSSGGLEPGVEQVEGEFDVSPDRSDTDSVEKMRLDVVDDQVLRLTANESMAEDPDTVWPILIDPPITGITRAQWTALRSAHPAKYNTNTAEGVGLCEVSKDATCQKNYKARLYWNFTGLATFGTINADQLVSAKFSAKVTHSYNCKARPVNLLLMDKTVNASTTWDNKPAKVLKSDAKSPVYRSNCGSAQTITWNAMDAAKEQASKNKTVMPLSLRSPDEDNMTTWRRFEMNTTKLEIEYNRPPNVPSPRTIYAGNTALGCENPWLGTATPTLSGSTSDPDDDKVFIRFKLETLAGSTWTEIATLDTASKKANGATKYAVTMSAGVLRSDRSYRWRGRAIEGTVSRTGLKSDWSPWCSFRTDVDPPPAPRIIPLTNSEGGCTVDAVYDQHLERGGLGVRGCFKIGYWPGSPSHPVPADIAKVVYEFGTGAAVTKATSKFTIVSYAPNVTYPITVKAHAYDLAGNKSSTTTYTFRVATAREDGIWTFDDVVNLTSSQDPTGLGATGRAPDHAATPGGVLTAEDMYLVGPTWSAQGPHTLFKSRGNDKALTFDGVNDLATTRSPVIDTTKSFVVSAHINPVDVGARRTVMSQDRVSSSAWRLDYLPGAQCPGTSGHGCWGFTVYQGDGSQTQATVKSALPARIGQWSHVTAQYDQSRRELKMWTCEIGTPEVPSAADPSATKVTTGVPVLTRATGNFVLGRALTNGQSNSWWKGQLDNVRIFKGEVVAEAKVRRMCQGAEANDYVDETWRRALDPTVQGQ